MTGNARSGKKEKKKREKDTDKECARDGRIPHRNNIEIIILLLYTDPGRRRGSASPPLDFPRDVVSDTRDSKI